MNNFIPVLVAVLIFLGIVHPSFALQFSNFGGCPGDCSPPTLGMDGEGVRLVTHGFTYNGNSTDVELSDTPFQLITYTGKNNTAEFKIYEDSGLYNIRHFDFAFGLAKGQNLQESKVRIEWNKSFDGKETLTLVDPKHALENVKIVTGETSCGNIESKCLDFIIYHTFREPLEFDGIATNVWDEQRNGWQNYFNPGINVTAYSMKP